MSKLTEYDELVNRPELQILKAMVPYVDPQMQEWLVIYIQTQTLQHALSISWPQKEAPAPKEFISFLRPYGGPKEQAALDELLHSLEAMELYQRLSQLQKNAKGPLSPMDLMKEMLPPEQAAMFQTYSTLFQNLGGD